MSTCTDAPHDQRERSAAYAAFAQVFRYPASSAEESVAYLATFDPAVARGAIRLHESAYSEHERAAIHEELLRYYEYFGVRRAPGAELPDHLVVELEFMQFLCWREERARERGEDVTDLRRAQYDFLVRHVSKLVRSMVAHREVADEAYRQVISELSDFIDGDLQAIGAAAEA
ncbi:MAG: molecular chaperone TorD family protein [Gammaproteobacteria bacterium]|nr:molecular chaperone TorD family protein [Gammaproteobacteria bacterium]